MVNANDLIRLIQRVTKPIKTSVMMMIGRCVLLATTDDTGIQSLKVSVMAGEKMEDIERFQNYGLTSHVPDNSEGVMVFPMGNREHGICIVLDNRKFRLKSLAKGEVALYTDEGDSIHMKRGNKIEINAVNEVKITTKKAIIDCEESEVNASVKATITAPVATIIAATKVDITTPICNVSGNLNVGGVTTTVGLIVGGVGNAGATIKGDVTIENGELDVQNGGITALTDIVSQAEVEDSNGTLDAFRQTYNGHTHEENGDGGGTTDAPTQQA